MHGLAILIVDLTTAGWRRLVLLLLRLGLLSSVSARQRAVWREAARAAGLAAMEESPDGLSRPRARRGRPGAPC
jgi:hypothetical protein